MTRVTREPGATLHQRMIARARTLLSDPAFRVNIEAARIHWDTSFPDFPIGKPTFSPVEDPRAERGSTPCSERLDRARQAKSHEFVLSQGWDLRGVRLPDRDPTLAARWSWAELNYVVDTWAAFVTRFALEWWPPHFFRVWDAVHHHPADAFVAACLLWRMESVTEEWIRPLPLMPRRLDEDDLEYWFEMANRLFEELQDRIRRDGSIDADALAHAIDTAHTAALEQFRQYPTPRINGWSRELANRFYGAAEDYFESVLAADPDGMLPLALRHVDHLPIYPDMRTTDWRTLEPRIRAHLEDQFGSTILPIHVNNLRNEGRSISYVAAMLGVSRKTVAEALANSGPFDPDLP